MLAKVEGNPWSSLGQAEAVGYNRYVYEETTPRAASILKPQPQWQDMDSVAHKILPREELRLEIVDSSVRATENAPYTVGEGKRVRRRLDMWLMPILMISYALQ